MNQPHRFVQWTGHFPMFVDKLSLKGGWYHITFLRLFILLVLEAVFGSVLSAIEQP